MKKKLFALIIVMLLITASVTTGCGNKETQDVEPTDEAAEAEDVEAAEEVAEAEEAEEPAEEVEVEEVDIKEQFREWLEKFAAVDPNYPEDYKDLMTDETYDVTKSIVEKDTTGMEGLREKIKESDYEKIFIWDDEENTDIVYIAAAWEDLYWVCSGFNKTPNGLIMSGETPPIKYTCRTCHGIGKVEDEVCPNCLGMRYAD